MKSTIALMLILSSVTTFASETCVSAGAKAALTQAKALNANYKECKTFECAELESTAVQDKMCDAAKACEEIAFDMYYPCEQRIALTQDDYDASKFLGKLIKTGLKQL